MPGKRMNMSLVNLRALVFRVLRIVFGIILILVSILGFLLPFLPGWPFLVAGVLLIWPDSRFAAWATKKYEKLKGVVQRNRIPETENAR
jgi:uncharacterized membrane protein YbaN (DUF454 family)